jgi:acyl-CoA reductase-like NAD-dependent aldehyde dehydrogenase
MEVSAMNFEEPTSPTRLPLSYPYLVSVNSVLPAIIAGNAVLLKPSPQTPLAAERFMTALHLAGVPKDVIQVVHLSPALTTYAVRHSSVNFVSFTGSVSAGRSVDEAAAGAKSIKGVALEVGLHLAICYLVDIYSCTQLGGKDPAYVRPDADLDYTAAELVDG